MPEENVPGWTEVIRPGSSWFQLDLPGVWRYRDLVRNFVYRDFSSVYKQTLLGPAWFVLQPLLTTVVFTVVFGRMAGLSTDGTPGMLFYFCGVMAWKYFADCLTKTSDTFIQNRAIFSKVYFPRLVIPLSILVSNLVHFLLQYAFFWAFLAWFMYTGAPVRPGPAMLLTPVLLLLMAALGLGLGTLVSSLTTRYRDLRFLVAFGVQLLMYCTPVIYPLSSVPERWRALVLVNPMTAIIETFRHAYLGTGTLDWAALAQSAGTILVLLVLGLGLFAKAEKTFMDTV